MELVFPVLLGGLAVAAVPILIHLIMRQKPKTLPFPAFRFLLQKHRTNLRKLRLRHLLLLLLRMLLIALLCLALARPKLASDPLQLNTDRPVAAVLLFDTSASMEYKQAAGPMRLDEAKRRGLQLLDALPEGSKIAVLDTAENVQLSKGEWTLSKQQARQRIQALRLRYESEAVTTRLESAYRLFAAELAPSAPGGASEASTGRGLNRLLCIFSDRTKASWDATQHSSLQKLSDALPPVWERLQAAQAGLSARLELLEGLRAKVPPREQQYPDATFIDTLQQLREKIPAVIKDDWPDGPVRTLVAAARKGSRELLTLLHEKRDDLNADAKDYRQKVIDSLESGLRELSGVHELYFDVGVDEPLDLALVDLALPVQSGQQLPQQIFSPEDKVLLRATVQATGKDYDTTLFCQVAGGRELPRSVKVAKGARAEVAFEIECQGLPSGPQQVVVRLATPDQLDFDNRRFVTFQVREPRRVLLLTDAPADARRWQEAIEARRDARFRVDVKDAADGAPTPVQLAAYAAVYLFNVKQPTSQLWASLRAHVQQGGNLAIVPPREIELRAYHDDRTAQELLPGKFGAIQSAKDPGAVWTWEDAGLLQAPLWRPVRGWRALGPVDFIAQPRGALRYYEVEPAREQTTVLMRYADDKKRPALLERTLGKEGSRGSRVLLFTTCLDAGQPPWNNYMEAVTSFCVVLPWLTTSYLAGDTEQPKLNFLSGKEVPRVPLPPTQRVQTLTLHGPGILDSSPRTVEQTELLLRQAVVPGSYNVEDAERKRLGAFSVNCPGEECQLERVPMLAIEAVLSRDALVPLERDADLREALKGHWPEPLELLPYLLMLLLVLLACENLLANLFYKREPQPTEAA